MHSTITESTLMTDGHGPTDDVRTH